MGGTLQLLLVGDLILDEPDPSSYFQPSRATLLGGDVVVGHVEVPHTDRGTEQSVDIPAPPAAPEHLDALPAAGFHVATLAGNHIYDAGAPGVQDTRERLENLGVQPVGAGRDLHEACRPAVVERGGRRIGVLSYNCVGPKESWATSGKAGCAYVHVITHYELEHATPGGPPTIYTFATDESLQRLHDDIAALAARVDIVVVAFHKGIGHIPATLAGYEVQVAHAAIDAGADVVVGHHAHILRGVELYRGKPVFHGLGNFVTVTRALTPDGDSEERRAWAQRREALFGFRPDPDMPTYPFHPESRNAMIAVCDVTEDGTVAAGFVPCYIDDAARPEVFGEDARGRAVAGYVESITTQAGLPPLSYRWDGGVVRFTAGS